MNRLIDTINALRILRAEDHRYEAQTGFYTRLINRLSNEITLEPEIHAEWQEEDRYGF
jgi:hypothetical protein